jgi:hypothetical protein
MNVQPAQILDYAAPDRKSHWKTPLRWLKVFLLIVSALLGLAALMIWGRSYSEATRLGGFRGSAGYCALSSRGSLLLGSVEYGGLLGPAGFRPRETEKPWNLTPEQVVLHRVNVAYRYLTDYDQRYLCLPSGWVAIALMWPPLYVLLMALLGGSRRARSVIRRCMWSLLFMSGAAMCSVRPWVWHGSETKYFRSALLKINPPADRVIYEESPGPAVSLITFPQNDSEGGYEREGLAVAYSYHALGWLNKSGLGTPAGIAFCHTRQSPGGEERMVIVGCYGVRQPPPASEAGSTPLAIAATASPTDKIWISSKLFKRPRLDLPTATGARRLYAGQIDPGDASHFTIRYEINDKAGTIDGWLGENDTVKLQVRNGPAASQPSTAPAITR